jgi:hypothetical protein
MEMLSSEFAVSPGLAVSVIGPAICPRCYQVGEDIAAEFPREATVREGGRLYLDLPLFAERQLLESGITRGNIFRSGVCTSCDSGRCFSHRRERGVTGRHWSIAFMGES